MSPLPNNQDTRSVVVSNPPTSTTSDDTQQTALDNPYLVGLSKKTRGLRKKLDKIKKTEALHASDKQLNDEQLKLLESKPFLLFALAEHERIRTVMEIIAKQQAHNEEQQAKPDVPVPPMDSASAGLSISSNESERALSIPSVEGAARSEVSVQTEAQEVAAENQRRSSTASNLESVGIGTDPMCVETVGTQTDSSGPPPPRGLDPREVSEAMAAAAATAAEQKRVAQAEAEAKGLAAGRAEAVSGVAKLLRLLHVANRFQAKSERLPTAVDFFSKVLLGKTVPPDEADFDSCLEQSVERAMLYLDSRNGSREVAPGLSFLGLEKVVSDLRDEIVAPPAAEPPLFNFFGDTCIPVEGDEGSESSPDEPEVACAVGAAPDERAPEEVSTSHAISSPDGVSTPEEALVPGELSAPEGSTLQAEETSGNRVHLHEESRRQEPTARSRETAGTPGDGGVSDSSGSAECDEGSTHAPPARSLGHNPGPAHEPGSTVTLTNCRGDPRNTGQEDPPASNMMDNSEGQASRMEEGVLLPVVAQSTSHYPPAAAVESAVVDTAVVESEAALPKRERRTKTRARSPNLAYPPASAAQQYIPQNQGVQPAQAVPHTRHVGSFPQQPTPPLTPVQMGHAGHTGHAIAPPVPALSPPTSTHLGAPAPGGSPVLTPHAGWCYNQPPPLPPQVVLTHRQTHTRLQQQPTVRPPMHMVPGSLKPEMSHCNGPWAGCPSTMMYPGEVPKMQVTSQAVDGGGACEGSFAGGLQLVPEHAQENGSVRPGNSPPNNGPPPPQNPPPPPPQSLGDLTVQHNNASSVPSPKASTAEKIRDLETEVGSSWQGVEQGAVSSGIGDGGKYSEAAEEAGPMSVRSDNLQLDPVPENGSPPSQLNVKELEGTVDGDQQPPQVVPSNQTNDLLQDSQKQSSIDAIPSEENTSSAPVSNQAVPDSPSANDFPRVPNPREGHGRMRGTGSRGRGGRRVDHRIKSRHPMLHGRRGGPDELASKGQGQDQDQDQGQGQGQGLSNPRGTSDAVDQKQLKPHGRYRHQGRVQQPQQHPRVASQAQSRDNGVYPRHHKRQVLSESNQAYRDGDDRLPAQSTMKNGVMSGSVAGPVDHVSRKNGNAASEPTAARGNWADDMTSSDSSPPVQRAVGGRRGRQSSHRSNADGKQFAERRVPGGSGGQVRAQSEKQEVPSVNENNPRDGTHSTRTNHRVAGVDGPLVPHRNVDSSSTMGPSSSSRSREHPPRSHVESNGAISGAVSNVRNTDGSSPDGEQRHRAEVNGGVLTRGAGASQRTSSRKNRMNTIHRRRGGSSGMKGGRGVMGTARGSYDEHDTQQRRVDGKQEQHVDSQPSA